MEEVQVNGDEKLLKFVLNILHYFGYDVMQKPTIFITILKLVHFFCSVLFLILMLLYVYYDVKEVTIDVVNKLIGGIVAGVQVSFFFKLKNSNKNILNCRF